MSELFKRFFQICVLARGPQDLPYSQFLLRLCLLTYFFAGLLRALTWVSLPSALGIMLLDIGVLLAFSWVCLQSFKHLSRFVQMISALCGVGTLFYLMSIPVLAQIHLLENAGQGSAGLSMILFFLICWNLAVVAHIFRESFSVSLPAAFVLTLAYVMIEISIGQLLFPELRA